MLENRKLAVDKGKLFGCLLPGLFKAFSILPVNLLFEKLHAYGIYFSV